MKSNKFIDGSLLSDWGLLYKINTEVLHPYGLALSYDQDTGDIQGVIRSNRELEPFDFTSEQHTEGKRRLGEFDRAKLAWVNGALDD
jgi:hypothetical protein